MRITISHNRLKGDVIQSSDRSFEQMFEGVGALPVRLTVAQRNWQGSTLNFSLTAKNGLNERPSKAPWRSPTTIRRLTWISAYWSVSFQRKSSEMRSLAE